MNVPGIRKALEKDRGFADLLVAAARTFGGNGWAVSSKAYDQMLVIADILREAGVEVEG